MAASVRDLPGLAKSIAQRKSPPPRKRRRPGQKPNYALALELSKPVKDWNFDKLK